MDSARKARRLLAVVAIVALAGCGGDGANAENDDAGVDGPPPCPTGETRCDDACVDIDNDPDHCGDCATVCGSGQSCGGGVCVDETPATEDELSVDVVATGLEVVWEIRFLPDGDMLVTERPGRVSRVAAAGGAVTLVGTLPVVAVNESGLMGMALDPEFATNGHVYVCYTYNDGGLLNKVSRVTFSDDALSDEIVLVDGIQGAQIHDGCRIGFGPDDKLYVTMGDANDTSSAQDMESLNGKVLRMNADGSVPNDNPFPGSLIYTLGHRNPQGLDWHRSGVAFVSEHGPAANDEVNRLIAGRNYGWPTYGGAPGVEGFEDAIYDWTPTIAPAGAVFYDGVAVRGWRGSWVMLTLRQEDVRRLAPANESFTGVASEHILFDGLYGRLRAIRVGPDGFLYVGTSNRDGRGFPAVEDDRILRIRM